MQKRLMVVVALMLVGLFVLSPTLAWAQDGDDGKIRHTVQTGENLYRISLQYGTSVQAIALENNITNPNLIVVGQELIIPVAEVPADTETDKTGDEEPVDEATEAPTADPIETEEPTAEPTEEAGGDAETPDEDPIIYVVQQGDNLYRIASDFGTTVRAIVEENSLSNPNVIHVGTSLRIPADAQNPDAIPAEPTDEGDTATETDTPEDTGDVAEETATPEAAATEEATDNTGDTTGTEATATPVPSDTGDETATGDETGSDVVADETITPTPTEIVPVTMPASAVAFDYGIEVDLLLVEDKQAMLNQVKELGMKWIKQEVDWGLLQPNSSESADPLMIGSLDQIVQLAEGNDLNLMLTIVNAPAWTRTDQADVGPALDNADFIAFVDLISRRYAGLVEAYEIWNEPNVASNWRGKPLSGASYAELLRVGYATIKAVDPDTLVISAGLAPTGLNDGVNAIDDRTFLRQMYQAGVADYTDAIGAHPLGAANAPDDTCCGNDPNITGWNDHPTFFFLDNLRDYRAIMNEYNDSGKFIWATQFGWGADEGSGNTPDEGLRFVSFIGMQEQADYTVEAFQLGKQLGFVGPMFAWNFNFCEAEGGRGTSCFWSFLNPAGDPRTVYFSVRDMAK